MCSHTNPIRSRFDGIIVSRSNVCVRRVFFSVRFGDRFDASRWQQRHRRRQQQQRQRRGEYVRYTETCGSKTENREMDRVARATTEYEKSNSNSRKKWNVKLVFFQPSFVCINFSLARRALTHTRIIYTTQYVYIFVFVVIESIECVFDIIPIEFGCAQINGVFHFFSIRLKLLFYWVGFFLSLLVFISYFLFFIKKKTNKKITVLLVVIVILSWVSCVCLVKKFQFFFSFVRITD